MKKKPMTIFLPENLIKDLRSYVPKRCISEFISQAVEEKIKQRKDILVKDLVTASSDKHRIKECELWDNLINEGFTEKNGY